ncbi:DUF5666 domain-containing protein [Micromonospora sp. NBC_00898]|uniref:hypothetical protein n=1 Tax=Micromonospora sp. NBC_00898 TaxID=2975981 RepID=UPI0038683874|nr:DUF5666 domain-containing protein [Micromonospora sp. NBC_00898]
MDNTDTVIFDRIGDEPSEPLSRPAEPDRGLTAALAASAPRRWWNRGTVLLGGLLLVLVGFLGGVQVQQHWGDTPAAARSGRTGNFPGGFPSAFPGGSARGQATTGSAPAAAPATTGRVKLVDGGVLYLETSDGTVVTVRTTDRTAVQTSKASDLSKLKAGQSVSVQGDRADDGTVTATTVTAAG